MKTVKYPSILLLAAKKEGEIQDFCTNFDVDTKSVPKFLRHLTFQEAHDLMKLYAALRDDIYDYGQPTKKFYKKLEKMGDKNYQDYLVQQTPKLIRMFILDYWVGLEWSRYINFTTYSAK